MPKILFHICCGPCGTASLKKLLSEGYLPVGYYYNPNIHPKEEYEKRLTEAKKLAEDLKIELLVPDYAPEEYARSIKGLEDKKKLRCEACFRLRLTKTAEKTRELGFKHMGSTLRISPYQNQEKLLAIAKQVAKENGLIFYDSDLVSCFLESIKMSKDTGMYRQKYCGCIFSKEYK